MSRNSRRNRHEAAAAAAANDTADFEKRTSEEQLTILEALIEEARASTYEAINSHYRDFLSIRFHGQDPLDEVATLNDKYGLVQSTISPSAQRSSERLDTVGRALRAIVRLAKIHANLKDIDDQILQGDIAVAASSVAEIGELLAELEDDLPLFADAQAVNLLQMQYLKKRSALRAELDYLMAEMYQINDIGSSVVEMVVSYCVMSNYDDALYDNPVAIDDLFFALTKLDLYRDKMDVLADALIHRWFIPLLRNPNESLAVSKVKLSATINVGAYTASSSNRGNGGGGGGDAHTTLSHCELVRDKWSTVLDFIRDEMFHDVSIEEEHTAIYEYLGSRLWAALCPRLHQSLLVPLVPADIDAIGDTQNMVPLLELEERWLGLGLIAEDQMSIKDSICSLLQTYVSKRRRDLLTTVASVLATDDANTVVVGGEGPVTDMLCEYAFSSGGKKGASAKGGKGAFAGARFDEDSDNSLSFPRCSISIHAQTLVEFARETIGFTANADEEVKTAALYFHAVRDAFALYRCLMPCQWSAALVADPKRAFVMYNDCEFICHHLSTLGFRYREKWPQVLRASATFVDVIAAYRALSKACLSPLLTRLRTQIAQALGHSEWLQPMWLSSMIGSGDALDQCYESCEAQLALACGIIGQVAHVGAAHLPRSMYLRILGLLADVAVGHVSRRLEEIASAGDSTARALVRLATPIVALEDWFRSSPPTLASLGDGAAHRGSPISKYCKEWDSFRVQISRLDKMASHISTIT
ncbi:ribosome biogenesis protein ytm1 [Coemansia sp. RSA 2050]|nr:ribosome biogenesis protein ytm1 [Coemansia sp. RSA 2050]